MMSKNSPQQWVIGNWKMNPYFADAKALFQAVNSAKMTELCSIAIAPPSPYLALFAEQKNLPIVAQDVSIFAEKGAFTGESSADVLKSCQVDMVLIGHSERRELLREDTEILQKKIKNALKAGLKVVYCVGETLTQREAGQAQSVVLAQVLQLQQVLTEQDWENVMIAYEPVWAIGTGKTASPQDAQEMHCAIRQYLKGVTKQADSMTLLYGGSVKPENAVELAQCTDINGALVGGASLDANGFLAIAKAFA